MLLTASPVAKVVRSYLLEKEETSTSPKNSNLTKMAEELQQHAIHIGKHSDQLIAQAGLIKAMVGTINWHGENIQTLEKRCDSFENRIGQLEQGSIPIKGEHYITKEQTDILRAKVKKLGRPVTIWKQLNKHFGVSRYRFLPESRFSEAIQWLKTMENR